MFWPRRRSKWRHKSLKRSQQRPNLFPRRKTTSPNRPILSWHRSQKNLQRMPRLLNHWPKKVAWQRSKLRSIKATKPGKKSTRRLLTNSMQKHKSLTRSSSRSSRTSWLCSRKKRLPSLRTTKGSLKRRSRSIQSRKRPMTRKSKTCLKT